MRRRDRIENPSRNVFWVNQYAVPPDQPGGTRHFDMAATLSSQGRRITVIASDLNLTSRAYTRRAGPRDRRRIRETIDGVDFVWLPAGSYERNDWKRALSMALFALHVMRFLLQHSRRGDVVIGSTPQLPAAGAARVAAFVRRSHYVLEVRDLWPETLIEISGRTSLLSHTLSVFARVLYRTSEAIVVLAEGSRGPIQDQGGDPSRIYYVPNGVDLAAFSSFDDAALPPDLGWVHHDQVFVYAGAHGPANGLDLLLDAASELQRRGRDDLRLLLVGDGPEKRRLLDRCREERLTNVALHDPVPKQSIPALLRVAAGGLMILEDVALFKYGVSPNKLFDYLAADLPVITNVTGEVGRIVEESGCGLVIPASKGELLADAMVEVADGMRTFEPGSTYVRANHDRRELAERLGRVLDSIVRDDRAGSRR